MILRLLKIIKCQMQNHGNVAFKFVYHANYYYQGYYLLTDVYM
jgi:hypothetical protein